MLIAELSLLGPRYAIRRMLAAARVCALLAVDFDHLLACMSWTILRLAAIFHSKVRPLRATWVGAFIGHVCPFARRRFLVQYRLQINRTQHPHVTTGVYLLHTVFARRSAGLRAPGGHNNGNHQTPHPTTRRPTEHTRVVLVSQLGWRRYGCSGGRKGGGSVGELVLWADND